MMKKYGAALALALPLLGTFAPQVAVASPTSSVSRAVAAVRTVRQLNPSTFEVVWHNGQVLTLDFYGENIVRLFQDNKGGIVRNPVATPPAQILVDNPRKSVGKVLHTDNAESISIASDKIALVIDKKTGLMRVINKQTGKPVVEQTSATKFDKQGVTLTLNARPNEYFYGGGVQNGRFSHRGKSIDIVNTNNWVDGGVASPTPYYWSTAGYGVMWHTFKPGKYDFGASEVGKVTLNHNEEYLDLFLMVNDTPVGLLNDFYQLSGHPVLLPKFGFYQGHLNAYNRDYWTPAENGFMLYEDGKRYNESQKDNGGIKESLNGEKGNYQFSARAAIDRYIKNDMPLGWFLPNDGYGAGYGQTNSLDGNIQNLKEFGDYARSKGVEIGLWTQSDLHPKEGIEPLLQRDIVKEVRDAGVRVLKTDVAWVGAGYSFGLNGVADVGHIMPYYGGNARPFIISLDGWAGTQRYAGIWSGDQTGGEWEYIRFHIPTFIGSGLSGQPNISSDTDGIFGGKNVPVNVREFQWKTFTPMELNMDGWGTNAKYPEALGEPATSINRWYLKMKSELMPYAYSIAREAIDGKPMIRAMFLDYPNAYTLGVATQYQFLYGPYFLVAPVYQNTKMDKEGNDIRNGIYLPEGRWIDYYNGDVYQGGRIINNYVSPLWKLPVFVKEGAIIPMTNPNNNPTEIRKDYRAYELYPSGNSSFTEYDDDGVSQAYLQGKSTTTNIACAVVKDKLTVTIGATKGEFDGFEPAKETELRINVSGKPKQVEAKLGKQKLKLQQAPSAEAFRQMQNAYFYDESPNLNRFATKGSDFEKVQIRKNPQLLVKLAKTDVTKNETTITISGFAPLAGTDGSLLKSEGKLSAPSVTFPEADVKAYSIAPAWAAVANADYYEVEFGDMLYSTITDNSLLFDGLTPETEYTFKVRAVNKSGRSEWATATVKTKVNPLEFAIHGINAQTSCDNQPGTDINALFDFDEKSMWHTAWSKKAVPFSLTIDLRSINRLDKFVYLPREDSGNGTLLKGTVSYSSDKVTWSTPVDFAWRRDNKEKTFAFGENPAARYIRLHITQAAGDFGSGRELYVFKVPGTESIFQGDINKDKRIDENDFTSYMNYTGLRRGDGDFDYVSIGDVNANGLIDAYDISQVATQIDGGVRPTAADQVAGKLTLIPDKQTYNVGDEVLIAVQGSADMKGVNALSFALPYDAAEWEYVGTEAKAVQAMTNLTYDRLHTNGNKALYPTFVNRGNGQALSGNATLFVIKLKAKRKGKFNLKAIDGILVDKNLGSVKF